MTDNVLQSAVYVTPELAIAQIRAEADPVRAAHDAAGHRTPREGLGLRVPRIAELATEWRKGLSLAERVALADALWRADIRDARVGAAKLLTQARITPDTAVWRPVVS